MTEARRIEQYQKLVFEVGRIHQVHVEVVVVPLNIGPLEQSQKTLWQDYLGTPDITGSAQMMALLETSLILRKVLHL